MSRKSALIAIAATVLVLAAGAWAAPLVAARPPAEATAGHPAPGTPYAQARRSLLDQGMTPDRSRVDAPHPAFPELNCPGAARTACRALFTHKDDDGWRRYLVVETAGSDPVVTAARPPFGAEGLAAIPPPPAADIPKLPDTYGPARRALLRLGFKPAKASRTPWSVCARALEQDGAVDCAPDLALPEIATCAGAGDARCEAYWLAPDQRVLRIVTIGEPQPGAIYHLAWAAPDQLADLPSDWKP